jgi:thioredoxin 1
MALEINKDNVETVLTEKKVTVLDFWAPWCGPCRTLGPIIDDLSIDNEGNDVTIAKVNVDQNQELAIKYGVRGIPTVVILKDGEEAHRKVGVQSKTEYQAMINELL